VAQLAVEFNVIPMEGRSYFPPETDVKLVGVRKLIEYLTDNPEYTQSVIEPLVKERLENTDLRTTEINENELY
jgi:hypothetical protein